MTDLVEEAPAERPIEVEDDRTGDDCAQYGGDGEWATCLAVAAGLPACDLKCTAVYVESLDSWRVSSWPALPCDTRRNVRVNFFLLDANDGRHVAGGFWIDYYYPERCEGD